MRFSSTLISVGVFISTIHANITVTTAVVDAVAVPPISQASVDVKFIYRKIPFFIKNNKYLIYDPTPGVSGGITVYKDAAPVGSLCIVSLEEIQRRSELVFTDVDDRNKITIAINTIIYYLGMKNDNQLTLTTDSSNGVIEYFLSDISLYEDVKSVRINIVVIERDNLEIGDYFSEK